MNSSKRTDRDEGFTLLELLVTVLLMGVIASAVTTSFATIVRIAPLGGKVGDLETRADDARTLNGVVTWLPQDVDSTGPTGFDIAPTKAGCGSSSGVNVVFLTWTENTGGGDVTYTSNYRYINDGGGQTASIKRLTCNSLGQSRAITVSKRLPPMPADPTNPATPPPVKSALSVSPVTGDVELLTIQVRTLAGKWLKVDAAPKNPHDTLAPAVYGSANYGDGTPCSLVAVPAPSFSPSSSVRNGPANNTSSGPLQKDVVLRLNTIGDCGGAYAVFSSAAPSTTTTRIAVGNSPVIQITFPGIPSSSTSVWTDGSKTITVKDARKNDVVLWTGTLVIQ